MRITSAYPKWLSRIWCGYVISPGRTPPSVCWLTERPTCLPGGESPSRPVAGSVGQERPLYGRCQWEGLGAFQSDEVIRRRLMEEPITPLTERTIISPDELLKEYAKIRAQGYAISDGELSIETIGISAPIRDESGTVWAAISIGAPRLRVDQTKLERYIFLVKEIAKEVSKDLSSGCHWKFTVTTQENIPVLIFLLGNSIGDFIKNCPIQMWNIDEFSLIFLYILNIFLSYDILYSENKFPI